MLKTYVFRLYITYADRMTNNAQQHKSIYLIIMKKLFLLDAYALIYRSYYALIRSPRVNSKGMNTSAVMGFVNTLNEVITKERPDYLGVAFDHGKTFRHEAFPQYKAQRDETPEDIRRSVPVIKDILAAWHIPCLQVDNYEADDVIGAVATMASRHGIADEMGGNDSRIETFMLTPDKDYGQLVKPLVKMYKPRHGGGYDILGEKEICEKYNISSPSQVIDLLALMGDSADNFPGCPGVGEKTAIKLISEWQSCENLIAHAQDIKGAIGRKVADHADDIRMSKFLATIRTDIEEVCQNFDDILESMTLQEPDAAKLSAIFDELEFRTLAKKILGGDSNAAAGTVPSGNDISLFDSKSPTDDASSSTRPTPSASADAQVIVTRNLFGEEELINVNVKKSKKHKTDAKIQTDENAKFPTDGAEDGKFRKENSLETVSHSYYLVDTLEDTARLCDRILTNEIICFDTETTSKSSIEAELVGMSFAVAAGEAWYVSVPGKMREVAEAMRPVLENAAVAKVGQNMKYDIEVLSKYGVEVKGQLFDTMIAHYLLQPELRHNMDYMAETLLGYRTIHYDDIVPKGKTMADLHPIDIRDYACEDADITLQLWQVLQPRLHEQEGLWQLFTDIEMPLVEVLADMELTGVAIDTAALREVSRLFTQRMSEHEQRIYSLAGKEFNINSPRQVGDILFGEMKIIEKPKRTKTGQYVTSEDVLTSLRGEHEIVAEILDYRGLKKLVGTYVDALPKLVNKSTGHIHTSFNQCVTATGRLSSSDPNLQNIPVRGEDGKEIRRCFIAGDSTADIEGGLFAMADEAEKQDNYLFFSADYSQIELRVMAHLSGDEAMCRAFREGYDVHAATAATVYGKAREDITRDERTKAKRANFGLIYGISAWGLSQSLMIDRKEARALMDGFFKTFPKVQEYMELSKQRAAGLGYAETLLHRRRYLPDINSGNATVRGFAERNAINAPIQGTAADIIKIAMVRIHRRFKQEGLKSKMILQVHDELNFSVPASEKDIVEKIVIHEMEHAYPLSVPLVADFGWGSNWLEAH